MTDDGGGDGDDDDDDDLHFLLSEKVKVGCVAKIYAVEFEISQFIAHNSRKSAIREQLASHVCISACTRHAYKCCTVSLSLSPPALRLRAFPNLSGRVVHAAAWTRFVFLSYSCYAARVLGPCPYIRLSRSYMAHLEQIFTWSGFFAWSCEDAAMNDKTLKCITMMSHEIKAIHSGALCEKYGNNIALGKQNSPPCIWNMW